MDTQTPGRQKADEIDLATFQGPACVLTVIEHVVILMSHHRGTTTGSIYKYKDRKIHYIVQMCQQNLGEILSSPYN